MKRFLLIFLSAPTILITVLGLVTPALTAGIGSTNPNQKFCINTHARLVCVKSSQIASTKINNATLIAKAEAEARNPDAFIDFTDEESDGAVAIFGCDCPACIRSLRQLRVMAKVG
jgi:hypothetical protein